MGRLAPTGRFRWWLVPLTCLPQVLMWTPFGPDTALGLLPTPHLLLFYGCFFWFGAGTYAASLTHASDLATNPRSMPCSVTPLRSQRRVHVGPA